MVARAREKGAGMSDDSMHLPMSVTRRQFLCRAGFAGALTGCASATAFSESTSGATAPLVGSNSFGWTQYAKREKRPFDIGETMSILRDCGYDYIEPAIDLGRPEGVLALAEQMKARGLKPVSVYCGPRLHEAATVGEVITKFMAAAKACAASGFEVISCNAAPIGRPKTDDELKIQAAAFAELGRGLKELGLRLGIHHHLPEMADGAREFHYNFRNTKPGEVGFCYDVHWVWKGGIGPADALREYGDRVVTWHIRQSRDGVWWEDLDTGDIDYGAVARHVAEKRLPRRFTVELAIEAGTRITRNARENHLRSRDFIRRVFGA